MITVLFPGMMLLTWMGCGTFDKKAPTKANFAKAIQDVLQTKPKCFTAEVPQDVPRRMSSDPRLDALVAVGLVRRIETAVKVTRWGVYDKPVPGYRYLLTVAGEKVTNHPPTRELFGQNQKEFCYGMPTLDEVVRFTEPSGAMGITMTAVTYRYHLKDIPAWAKNPSVIQAFFLQRLLTEETQPQQATMGLMLTSDGWRNHP